MLVSNVLILSTTGIRSPPSVVASLILRQEENTIIELAMVTPSSKSSCLFFTKIIYTGLWN